MAAATLNIDKPGKYPVVLSDALLGKAPKDVFTGIRYNHKPDSLESRNSLKLKPSDDPTTYDLSLQDNRDNYEYVGARSATEGQYVLIFDPVKKHFVLDRVDSTFDMNLVSAPWTQDADTLRSQYTQLEPQPKPKAQAQPPQRKASKSKIAALTKNATKKQKVEKPKKKPVRELSLEPEDDDSDDGLTIEYPDGPPAQGYQYRSTPVFQRTLSEASDEDAEGEEEEEEERNQDVDLLQLPSPANNNAGGLSDEELELDLEAELERALEETADHNGGESDESEEE